MRIGGTEEMFESISNKMNDNLSQIQSISLKLQSLRKDLETIWTGHSMLQVTQPLDSAILQVMDAEGNLRKSIIQLEVLVKYFQDMDSKLM